MSQNNTEGLAIQKVKDSLWNSLKKHLQLIYDAEKLFDKSLTFTNDYPFDPSCVDKDLLESYWSSRKELRNIFIDETEQLDTLIKAIRQKNYQEEDKRYLFLMILGYMDIAESTFANLIIKRPIKIAEDTELSDSQHKFDRLKKFVKLNIKGIFPASK